jgi:acyl-CoA hydrolase
MLQGFMISKIGFFFSNVKNHPAGKNDSFLPVYCPATFTKKFSCSMKSYTPVSAEEAVSHIQSNSQIFIHSAAASPQILGKALAERHHSLRNVTIYQIHTEGDAPYAAEECKDSFLIKSLFTGANMREAVEAGRAEFVPIFLSDIPYLFRRKKVIPDVALLQVSPPDRAGFCSLGVSVDTSLAAAEVARLRIAEINPNMPRTHGDGNIHISKFHCVTEVNYPLPTHFVSQPTEVEMNIGRHVADLVPDGATLQVGIGAIPNAALFAMKNHKELGIHTEMFSDGILPLIESGVVTNQHKTKHKGYVVTGFMMGTPELYRYVHDNPFIRVLDIMYVNDTAVIRQLPKVTAINSAIEVDLTGQVCADSIGTRIYSGVGGQMDFIRGAALSEGGKPIIALPSLTNKGVSRITPVLKPGAGVVTTRAHVQFIVTEYGTADLFGKSIPERARALINIAHPAHREELEKSARQIWGLK